MATRVVETKATPLKGVYRRIVEHGVCTHCDEHITREVGDSWRHHKDGYVECLPLFIEADEAVKISRG